MPSFKHILFPVDFSQQSCGIAPYVVCMASRYAAHVTMLHAIELSVPPYPGWPAYGPMVDVPTTEYMREQWEQARQAMVEDANQRIDSFLRSEFQSIATTRLVRQADPAEVIAEYAEKENVDLIMMPTHGYGPFRRFLLGSVTAKVLHDAKCPVWTSAHAPESPAPPAGYRNALCAVDLTPKSLPLIQWSAGFASDHAAALKLVHAIPAAEPRTGLDIEGDRFRAFLLHSAREELAKLQKEAGTRFDTVLEGGDVARVVRRAAEENHADLVVIGRGVIQERFGRMRTHVYSVIREAPCPVISV
jgi:nucleotide-binding universal stress UspA family protein